MNVFRTPGNSVFDRTLRRLVEDDGAKVVFIDTAYTKQELERTEEQIWKRFGRSGDWIYSISPRPAGYLEIGVLGDMAAARRALAGYGDRVRVVKGSVGTPV